MKRIWLIMLLLTNSVGGKAQLLIDRGVQAAGVWCFPMLQNPNQFVYLPTSARLAMDENNLPKFSYLRYAMRNASSGAMTNGNTVSEAEGGGILHFMVLYETPTEQVKKAQTALREILKNDSLRLVSPVVFNQARFMLVSSILKADTTTKKAIAYGNAPVLENSTLAQSFSLSPTDSKIMLESFKMATPDVSLVFELGFSGLTDSYDADLSVNWADVKQSEGFNGGASLFFVSADVEKSIDRLQKNGAIQLSTSGSDAAMESLLNTVYAKLTDLMFSPVKPESVPKESEGLDLIGSLKSLLNGRTLLGVGANVAYQLKELRTEGTTNMKFKGRSTVNRFHYVSFNMGNVYEQFKNNPRIFKDVFIDDPHYMMRNIGIGIDGSLEKEFSSLIKSVTIRIKKNHQDSTQTVQEAVIIAKPTEKLPTNLSLSYPNKKDTNRLAWLEYDYQLAWLFQGGGKANTAWQPSDAALINLYTPYKVWKTTLEGDNKRLKDLGVRLISVQFSYSFFGENRTERLTIRPDNEQDIKQIAQFVLPNQQEDVAYSISWIMRDGTTKTRKGKDNFGIVFIDEF